jgi:hypothetical protein
MKKESSDEPDSFLIDEGEEALARLRPGLVRLTEMANEHTFFDSNAVQ